MRKFVVSTTLAALAATLFAPGIAAGDKIRFMAELVGDTFTMVRYEPAK